MFALNIKSMQTRKFRSLGLDVVLNVPSSVEEFDQNAKRQGACLDEAINNCVYRGCLAEFRDSFQAVVAEKTGIQRATKPVIDPDTKQPKVVDGEALEEWEESEAKYIGRVRREKGWLDNDNGVLQGWADEIASALVFDASAPERKAPKPKKLGDKFRAVAQRIFGNNTQEKYAKQFALVFTGDKEKDIDLLGWAIKKDVDAQIERQLEGVA